MNINKTLFNSYDLLSPVAVMLNGARIPLFHDLTRPTCDSSSSDFLTCPSLLRYMKNSFTSRSYIGLL